MIRHYSGFDLSPEDMAALLTQDFSGQSLNYPANFQHFPVQNIYNKEAIEQLLVSMDSEEHDTTEKVAVIEKEQLDDILLTNYLKNSLKPIDPFSVDNAQTNSIDEPRAQRALAMGVENNLSNSVEKEKDDLGLVPYNKTVYVPADKIVQTFVGDTTEKTPIYTDNSEEFVKYVPAPSIITSSNDEVEGNVSTRHPEELTDLITAEDEQVEPYHYQHHMMTGCLGRWLIILSFGVENTRTSMLPSRTNGLGKYSTLVIILYIHLDRANGQV